MASYDSLNLAFNLVEYVLYLTLLGSYFYVWEVIYMKTVDGLRAMIMK